MERKGRGEFEGGEVGLQALTLHHGAIWGLSCDFQAQAMPFGSTMAGDLLKALKRPPRVLQAAFGD